MIFAKETKKIDEFSWVLYILTKLNSSLVQVLEFKLPIENSVRTLIKIKKNSLTNVKYPRKYADIKKNHCKNK